MPVRRLNKERAGEWAEFDGVVINRERAFEELVLWLGDRGLTGDAPGYDHGVHEFGLFPPSDPSIVGRPSHRTPVRTRAQLQHIRAQREGKETFDERRWSRIWSELRDPAGAVRALDISRIPADAIAFYASFHFEPVDQWGISIIILRLLEYLNGLGDSLGSLYSLPPSVLAPMVLFDVFHHEFFHHNLVECAATSVEILWPAPERSPLPSI
jgi:hypothetical protein